MFEYWREDKSLEIALEDYYPNTLANNPCISQAWATIKACRLMPEQEHTKFVRFLTKMSERVINAEFERLAAEEEEED